MSKPMSEQMQKLAARYEKATGKKFDAKTNAQKIRAMTDEELAKAIAGRIGANIATKFRKMGLATLWSLAAR